MGQSSASTDDVTVSCAPGCRAIPDQARLSAGLSGDVEKTMPFTLTPCRESEPVGAMTSGVAGCSTTKPPAGFARSVRGWESGDSRPDRRSVPSTLQMIEPVLLVVQAALSSMSERVGTLQCALLKANTRAHTTSARALEVFAITGNKVIYKAMKQKLATLEDVLCRNDEALSLPPN